MVFESLLSPTEAESKPWEAFVYSALITSACLGISYYIFPSQASILFLFLVTIACFPLAYRLLADEEQIDEEQAFRFSFLEKHGRAIKIYGYLFLGVLFAVAFWNGILPEKHSGVLFEQQIATVNDVRSLDTGAAIRPASFFALFLNNAKVATVAFALSLLFGIGAVFVIAWNASVIGVFITQAAGKTFLGPIGALVGISLHGIPEMVAYLVAGVAGGILSMGLMRNRRNLAVIEDSLFMFSCSILLLAAAAGVEAFITPLF